MNMTSAFNIVPDDYEIITTLDVSGAVREYIASYKPDKTPVHLRVYSFTDTTDTTMHRHLRNYLRKDVGFMEELDHPNIIRHIYNHRTVNRVISPTNHHIVCLANNFFYCVLIWNCHSKALVVFVNINNLEVVF